MSKTSFDFTVESHNADLRTVKLTTDMRFSCLNNPDNNKGWQKFNANLLLLSKKEKP